MLPYPRAIFGMRVARAMIPVSFIAMDSTGDTEPGRWRSQWRWRPQWRRNLVCAAFGLVVAVVAARMFTAVGATGLIVSGSLQDVLAYLATWVPMLAAVVVAYLGAGWRGAAAGLGLRGGGLPGRVGVPLGGGPRRDVGVPLGVAWSLGALWAVDVLWGVAAGCLARAIDAFVNIALYRSTGLNPQPSLGAGIDGWFIVTGLLAPVLLAPVIEEIFFRGLLQRSLIAGLGRGMPPVVAAIGGVVVTSAVFALVHILVGMSATGGATVFGPAAIGTAMVGLGLSTFVFALAAGAIAAATGRIRGAIVAHVVFNGLAVLLTWPR